MKTPTYLVATLGLICCCSTAWASNAFRSDVTGIANDWAKITYVMESNERKDALSGLKNHVEILLSTSPNDEDLLTWSGIITASHAGEVGGLKALKIVKKARNYFERAMKINPDALNGGARTSLGALYYQVPGWPIGFGNNKKAEQLLTESATKFPDDINALYFLADFLVDQKRNDEAILILEKASTLNVRDAFDLADTGRLIEIRNKLSKLQ